MGFAVLSILFLIAVIPIIILTYIRKLTFFQGVFTSSASMLISFFMSVADTKFRTGENIIDFIINDSFNQLTETFSNMSTENLTKLYGSVPPEQVEAARASFISAIAAIKDAYIVLFPAICILTVLMLSYILFMIVKNILGLLNKDISSYPKFSQLRLTKGITLALGFSLLGSTVAGNIRIANAFLNISTIIIGASLICGFSFIDFNIRKRVENAWMRIFVYIAVLFLVLSPNSIALYILVFIAIFDSFFNFRRLRIKEGKNG